jgi:thymidine phosphorylase
LPALATRLSDLGLRATLQTLLYPIRGEIPDYQAAAWAMAVVLSVMSMREITDLTLAMANPGEVLDLSGIVPVKVD